MYYPREIVDEVLANTDIVDVVSAHVHLKKRGKEYVGLCPFHNEKTPSFNVIPGKSMYYCFGCGASGNAITFLMKYNNSTFVEALQELADRAQVTLPKAHMSEETKAREKHRQDLLAVNKETATYYYKMLRSRRGERGMRYFLDRGLTPETLHMFGLGFADGAGNDLTAYLRKKGFSDQLILESDVALFNEKQGMHDRFWNRVMFPIQDTRGRVIGFGGRVLGDSKPKYINSSDTPVFDKGRNLYALNLARRNKKDHMILCEGYMDVIAMHQAGFTQAVASLGTAFTPGQAALLRRFTRRVLLAYDSDGAGVRAALRNIGILRAGGLETAVIDLRPHKDPDEFIKAEGKEAFQERIDRAENSFFYELRILAQSFKMDDPASRTAFHREIAKKLCTFTDEIERENYIAASAEKYLIRTDSLRRLVASYRDAGYGETGKRERDPGETSRAPTNPQRQGREPSSAAGEPQRAESSGPPQRRQESGPVSRSSASRAALSLFNKQKRLLTMIAEDPAVYHAVREYLEPSDFAGAIYRKIAECLWKQVQEGRESVLAASVVASFETREEQEEAAAILNTRGGGEDPADAGNPARILRELTAAVKEASVERMTHSDAGPPVPLSDLLAAKKQLQAIKMAKFRL